MKREADADMGSPQKRSRRGDEEVRLLIPSKAAGCIIGKGGQNITKLRSQYKASITVPDCPGPERLLTLSSDLETICNIINDVIPNLEENNIKTNVGGELDLRMMIHQSQAGCVIGKSGQKIKELRETTGARIKIFTNPAPRSTDRVIQIIGDSSKCIQTIREVLTLIKGSPVRGIVNAYDPHNYDEYYADEYGGWGSMGGNSRRDSGMDRNQRNSYKDTMPGSGPPRGFNNNRGGGGGGVGGGGGGGGRNMSNYTDRPNSGGMSGGARSLFSNVNRMNGDSYTNVWDGPPHDNSFNQPPPMLNAGPAPMVNKGPGGKDTTQVTIPKDLAGAIIGKGGGRIRKIRQDSGAGITIDEPLPGSTDRIITISGLPNQIQMAQYLLQQSVHNNADRNAY